MVTLQRKRIAELEALCVELNERLYERLSKELKPSDFIDRIASKITEELCDLGIRPQNELHDWSDIDIGRIIVDMILDNGFRLVKVCDKGNEDV